MVSILVVVLSFNEILIVTTAPPMIFYDFTI